METVYFDDARKKRFLETLKKGVPTEKRAAIQAKVAFSEVKKWLTDPDFAIAVTEAKEMSLEVEAQLVDTIEDQIYQAAAAGDTRLGLDVLRARRPEKWNPAMKVDINLLKHRFIDFSGQPLHEVIDPIDADFERIEDGESAED